MLNKRVNNWCCQNNEIMHRGAKKSLSIATACEGLRVDKRCLRKFDEQVIYSPFSFCLLLHCNKFSFSRKFSLAGARSWNFNVIRLYFGFYFSSKNNREDILLV